MLVDPDQVVELRAPKYSPSGSKRRITFVEHFQASQLDRMAGEAIRLSGRVPAVYFTLNPVRLPLGKNPRGEQRHSAGDDDIVGRRRLLIDLDPVRPADTSATDGEKSKALEVANAVRGFLSARGWPGAILADSGNGYHLLYLIDLPNDDASRDLVQDVLTTLGDRFDTDAVQIDRTVYNASRITKLYGTMACKGQATADRPHRLSRLLEGPSSFTHVDRDQLAELVREGKSAEPTTPPPAAPSSRPGDGTTISNPDRRARAVRYLDACEPAVSGQKGHNKLFKVACHIGPGLDLPPEEAFALLRDRYNPRCDPPWTDEELRHKVEDAYRRETRTGHLLEAPPKGLDVASRNGHDGASAQPPGNGRVGTDRAEGPEPEVNEAPDDPFRLARAVLAEFAHRDGPTLAWYREAFYAWDGTAYRSDPAFLNRVVKLVKKEVDRMNRLALQLHRQQAELQVLGPTAGRPPKEPVAPKVTRRLIADVVQALASMTGIDQDAEAPFWIRPRPGDPSPTSILSAANGMLDLDAGDRPTLRPHTPRFFSTHALPYPYDPAAKTPEPWLKILDGQWDEDPASIRELQKWFAYVLTPDTKHQKILLLIGSPGSGRSTIKDVMAAIVGSRNVASTSAVALADRFGLEPLVGKTLAILGDARTGDTHDAAVMMDRLLRISGNDPVEVNRKGKPILHDVQMRTRLVIVSNEMPNFRDSSGAIVRRYLALCTPRSFEGKEDIHLLAKVKAELPGILNWAIAGRAMLREDGRFNTPPSAQGLLRDAKGMASPVAEFVADECILDPSYEVTVDDLWKKWQEWAERNKHQTSHRHLFGRNLRAATHYRVELTQPRDGDTRFRVYKGIGLKKDPVF